MEAGDVTTWVARIPGPDLSALHFALRLMEERPLLSQTLQAETTALADRLWNEIQRRAT